MKIRAVKFFLSMAVACACNGQGIITAVAGNGTIGYTGDSGAATSAAIGFPAGLAVDTAGNIYIGDSVHSVIRKVNASTGIISTYAGTGVPLFSGDGGPAIKAGFSFGPSTHVGMIFDSKGNFYFTDIINSRIRKIDSSGIITTVAGDNPSLGLTASR